jgi:hypothetical protein
MENMNRNNPHVVEDVKTEITTAVNNITEETLANYGKFNQSKIR